MGAIHQRPARRRGKCLGILVTRVTPSAWSRWWRALWSLPPRGQRLPLSVPRCATCGGQTVEIELIDSDEGWYLRYQGVAGSGNGRGDLISAASAQAIRDALHAPCAASIQQAGLYDGFGYCALCAAFYCATHWQLSASGGGRCPAGHFKSLDPHWSPETDA